MPPSQPSPSPSNRRSLQRGGQPLAAALLFGGLFGGLFGWCSALSAAGVVLPVAWNEQGRFEHAVSMPPGHHAEACVVLNAGMTVAWQFSGSAALAFNIHHHVGKEVIYANRLAAAVVASGSFVPKSAQEYCWMWTNPGRAAVTLNLQLNRKAD